MNDTRAGLEAALAANPDDFATNAAYADCLSEQGDPRGDYVRLQLALEDRNQPAERLRAMEQEAFTIRNAQEVGWLGPLTAHVNPAAGLSRQDVNIEVLEANVQVTYRRGWLDTARVRHLTPDAATALAACPVGRLIRELSVDVCHLPSLRALDLPNLRRLRIDGVVGDEGLADGAEFRPIPGWFHPVTPTLPSLIAAIPRHLPRLEELAYRVPQFTDAGVELLLRAGVVERLRGLDLSGCGITDDGALLLAAEPAVPELDYLILDHNHISPVGIDALAAVGVTISQRQYLGPLPGGEPADDGGEGIEF